MNRTFDPIDREFPVAKWRMHQALKQAEQRRMIAQAYAGAVSPAHPGGSRLVNSIKNGLLKVVRRAVPRPSNPSTTMANREVFS